MKNFKKNIFVHKKSGISGAGYQYNLSQKFLFWGGGFLEACFFREGADKGTFFARKKDFRVENKNGVYIVTLPYSEKTIKKLGIKKLAVLDNKLDSFSDGVYFSDFEAEGLKKFSARLKKSDGQELFNSLIPEIAVKAVKRRGKNLSSARLVLTSSEAAGQIVKKLAGRFRFISIIGDDDALWDNIYEETGLSLPFVRPSAALDADVLIYTKKENESIKTNGISIGFDREGGRAIGASSLTFRVGGAAEELSRCLCRPLTIGEIETLGCTYTYRISM